MVARSVRKTDRGTYYFQIQRQRLPFLTNYSLLLLLHIFVPPPNVKLRDLSRARVFYEGEYKEFKKFRDISLYLSPGLTLYRNERSQYILFRGKDKDMDKILDVIEMDGFKSFVEEKHHNKYNRDDSKYYNDERWEDLSDDDEIYEMKYENFKKAHQNFSRRVFGRIISSVRFFQAFNEAGLEENSSSFEEIDRLPDNMTDLLTEMKKKGYESEDMEDDDDGETKEEGELVEEKGEEKEEEEEEEKEEEEEEEEVELEEFKFKGIDFLVHTKTGFRFNKDFKIEGIFADERAYGFDRIDVFEIGSGQILVDNKNRIFETGTLTTEPFSTEGERVGGWREAEIMNRELKNLLNVVEEVEFENQLINRYKVIKMDNETHYVDKEGKHFIRENGEFKRVKTRTIKKKKKKKKAEQEEKKE